MIRRNLSHRLKKLEARFEPQTKPFEVEIHFVEPGTMPVPTAPSAAEWLTMAPGRAMNVSGACAGN